MKPEMEPGHLAFQIFALEIFRKDPELFETAHASARKNVTMALTHCTREEQPSLEAQLRALDTVQAAVGLMKLLGKDRPEDIPDLGPDPWGGKFRQ
ncbi:hypothetical protein [Roseibium sp.]|uniref:hypothetical protein n=1 Tax=Roseibium sp. TaxID=1936156 RepID=UPI003B52F808